MPRIVKGGLIQAAIPDGDAARPIEEIKRGMIDKHLALLEEAAGKGVQICCLQELFYGPYFPADQDRKWYALTESVPEGPTCHLMAEQAKEHADGLSEVDRATAEQGAALDAQHAPQLSSAEASLAASNFGCSPSGFGSCEALAEYCDSVVID